MHPNNIEYISKTKNKTRMKPKKEDPFQSPNIIDFSDKCGDAKKYYDSLNTIYNYWNQFFSIEKIDENIDKTKKVCSLALREDGTCCIEYEDLVKLLKELQYVPLLNLFNSFSEIILSENCFKITFPSFGEYIITPKGFVFGCNNLL